MNYKIKRPIAIALIVGILSMCVNISLVSAQIFKEDTLIEFENVSFSKNYSVESDPAASGGKYIVDKVSGNEKLEDPDSQPPEILIEFEATKDSDYFVWIRHNCADGGKDSFFIGFNDEKINSQYGTAGVLTGCVKHN